MKPEKGSPVFIDTIDVLLTDRIVKHAGDHHAGGHKKTGASDAVPPHQKQNPPPMKKKKLLVMCGIAVVVLAFAICCFLCIRNGCCTKRK